MKNKELYNKTIGILVDAYFKGTLQHENACACAVGNLISANQGIKIARGDSSDRIYWPEHSALWYGYAMISRMPDEQDILAFEQIRSTGYTFDEIIRIEHAFESVNETHYTDEDERQFRSLMKVVDVLDQIHENTDGNLTAQTKKSFIKPLKELA